MVRPPAAAEGRAALWVPPRSVLDVESASGDNPRVDPLLLIVEDDPSLREVIRLGLEGEGFRTVTAEDGPGALLAFASHNPDLVLLDVMLPGLDGFAVCRELRKVSLVPIVMLTARTSTDDVVEGLESGADDYVTKPFEFPELVARVRSVLRRASVRGAADAGAAASLPSAESRRPARRAPRRHCLFSAWALSPSIRGPSSSAVALRKSP